MTSQGIEAAEANANRAPRAQPADRTVLDPTHIEAVLFDLDGVITKTALVHAKAWKRAFDEFLREREASAGGRYQPFDAQLDYRRYVDGKPRYDGVAAFLQARGIVLPPGSPNDPPEAETICGLGNRKNRYFGELVARDGVEVYGGSIDLLRRLRSRGIKIGLVSSSRNTNAIVRSAGVAGLFDCIVDGEVTAQWRLNGKPAPDTYLEAARRLKVEPARAAMVEDALAGIAAGRAGGFSLVIGVARADNAADLRDAGADVVLHDLSELCLTDDTRMSALPAALDSINEIWARIGQRSVALFFDYDGTLTPIVDRPEQALLANDMRTILQELAPYCMATAVISGRARDDVASLVGLPQLVYAGSHGFDIAGPQGAGRDQVDQAYLSALQEAVAALRKELDAVPGVIIEDKTYAASVHFRLVADQDLPKVENAVAEVAARHPKLRRTGGKKIFELRPAVDWDKGKALLWLLQALGLDGPGVVPFYFGDDETDEDAFAALRGRGIGVLVALPDEATSARSSQAHYRLDSPDEVGAFLNQLTEHLRDRPA